MADLSQQITDAANGPASVKTDAGEVKARPISDLIAADRYLSGIAAAKTPRRGLRITRLVPPGAVDDQSSTG